MLNNKQSSLTLRVEHLVRKCSTRRVKLRCIILLSSFVITHSSFAADWPQWRGPNRDGVSKETGLLKKWPEAGPPRVWTAQGAGVGYSTPSIADGRMFVMGDRGEHQFVICFDANTGAERWNRRIGKQWIDSKPFNYHGARCTPTVDGNQLYALGTHGDLVCLRVNDGSVVWSVNVLDRFNGANIKWGISESPLIDGDRLYVMPSGKDATVAALDKNTGDTIWSAVNTTYKRRDAASYASMLAADINGERQIIANTHEGGIGTRASDGKILWTYKMGGTSSNTTPVVHNGKVFFTGAYGPGCALVDLNEGGAKEVYANRNLRNHTGGAVLIDGYLYGCSGAFGPIVTTCIKFETGEVMWKDRGVGDVSVSYADGRLYLREITGHVVLVDPNPEKYTVVSRFFVDKRSGQRLWPHPVIANGKLYLRDQDNVQCYDIAEVNDEARNTQ